VRVPAHLPDSLELRCQAAALLVPDAAFSHVTAAALLGLPLPARDQYVLSSQGPVVRHAEAPDLRRAASHGPPAPLHLTMAAGSASIARRHPVGLVCHVSKLTPAECDRRPDGLLITSAARTWADLAGSLDLIELVAVADAALRRQLARGEQLAEMVKAWSRRPGAGLLRRALPLVEPNTDSPMETRLRLLLVLAGLPRPAAGRDVTLTGAWIARPDLSYPELRIAIEYDGDHHRVDRQQWQNDIHRRRLLEEAGWLVLVFTADDVLRRPDETVRQVRSALQSRGRAA
jgi:hypothetical protein